MPEAPSPSPTAEVKPPSPQRGFVANVLWSWLGVAVQLLPGFVVTPYMILKLGPVQYGMWSLAFSVIGNYFLADFGFKSAAIRYAAHFRALGETDMITELVNTLLLYFSAVAAALVLLTLFIWQSVDSFFHIGPQDHGQFAWLVLLTGINVAGGVIGGVFSGCVEGFQRFDISNRLTIISSGFKSVGWFVLLAYGHGLVAMGAWALVTSWGLIVMYGFALQRLCPSLSYSPRRASKRMFRLTAAYGLQTFVAGMAIRTMEQITPVLIGHYRSIADVGYYSFPLRLLQYGTDAVSRVGIVATPASADLAARRQLTEVGSLAAFANRYCLILFMPVVLFLGTYGRQLLTVWLRNPEIAAHSAPLLPSMIIGYTLAQAAQFCSASILFGLGAQRGYAIVLLGELALNVAGTFLVLPRYGILGAAVVTSGAMLISRGFVTPWLLCRNLHISFGEYLFRILVNPILLSLPFWAALIGMEKMGIAGRNLFELAIIGLSTATLYLGACYQFCIAPEHKLLLRRWVNDLMARSQKVVSNITPKTAGDGQ
jgi:O-antigen/teichoic acid export membrane protein